MTNDQFNSDQNDFDLSADSGDNLDMVTSAPEKRKSRAPFLLFLLLIIGGAAFAAYKVFLGGDMSMDTLRPTMQTPSQPVIADAQPVPSPSEPASSTLPEGVTADANAPAPNSPGMSVQDMMAKSLEPVTPATADATSTSTETVVADATPAPTDVTAPTTEATALPSPVAADTTAPATTETSALPAPVADAPKMDEAKPNDMNVATAKPDGTPVPDKVVTDAGVTEAAPNVVTPTAAVPGEKSDVSQAPNVTEATTPVADAKPVTTETVLEKAATPSAPAMPAPAQDQLKPIDTAATPTATQTQKTAAAVKEILGKDAIVSPEIKQAQAAAIAEPTEVTPHAREVIVVKKAYSASSSQAVNAAGERILVAGQYNEAADMFDSQLKKNPSDPLALAGKAQALQRAGRVDEALRTYDRLLQLNPRDTEALINSLGLVQMQNPQKALAKLQSMVQQYPDNAAVAGQLATTQARLMDTPNALRNFQKAMALDPTNPTYPFNMGVLYDRLGSVDKARIAYRQALDVAGAYPHKAGTINLEVIRNRMAAMGG